LRLGWAWPSLGDGSCFRPPPAPGMPWGGAETPGADKVTPSRFSKIPRKKISNFQGFHAREVLLWCHDSVSARVERSAGRGAESLPREAPTAAAYGGDGKAGQKRSPPGARSPWVPLRQRTDSQPNAAGSEARSALSTRRPASILRSTAAVPTSMYRRVHPLHSGGGLSNFNADGR
jgi:hypothetical protein